jgi:hypothetical protein
MKQKLLDGFGRKCGICGYNKSTRALGFHHLDPSTKSFTVSAAGIPRAWKKICDEVRKCVMLCHNCHEEVHEGVTLIPDDIRRFIEPAPLPMRRQVIRKRKTEPGTPRLKKVPNRPIGKVLRDLVWRTSRVAVGKQYGVSEAAVRKWLKQDSLNGIY